MIQHTVALTWNDAVPPDHANVCVEALMAMSRAIHTIREFRCGANLRLSEPTNTDFVIVATFDDVDGWRHYDEYPLHNEIRAKFFKPYVASRTAGQFSF
ncbi:MAG: Dabb family protein [Ilumatobacteraceae bacterium]